MIERRPFRLVAAAVHGARWAAKRALRRPARILVDLRWRLGDEIMAIPIYEGIKRRFPFCHLTVWCNHPDVLLRNPYVDRIVGREEDISLFSFDRWVTLRGAPRTGFRLDCYARKAGIPTPPSDPRLYYDDWDLPRLAELGLREKEFAAVCTGATWETKRWPTANWQTLCDALCGDGHAVLQLGLGDEPLAVPYTLLNATTVREAACALRAAKVLVSSDSGLMHLALAVGTPVVALFGPTDPTILVRGSVPLIVLTNGRPCQGCWNHTSQAVEEGVCPLGISPCMGPLAVDAVLARVRGLLGAGF